MLVWIMPDDPAAIAAGLGTDEACTTPALRKPPLPRRTSPLFWTPPARRTRH
jgi:hypothetical protein